MLELTGVLFCQKGQAQTKWIIVCSKENTYLDAFIGKLGEVSKQQ